MVRLIKIIVPTFMVKAVEDFGKLYTILIYKEMINDYFRLFISSYRCRKKTNKQQVNLFGVMILVRIQYIYMYISIYQIQPS